MFPNQNPDSMGSTAIQKENVIGPRKPFIPYRKKKGMQAGAAPTKRYKIGGEEPSTGLDFASIMRGR